MAREMTAKAGWFLLGLVAVTLLVPINPAQAHGEIAQMAGIRARTVHWFDFHIDKDSVAVNEEVTISGKFKVSSFWPEFLAKPEEWVFLNIGVPGPVLVRESATINGMPQIRSTALKRGEYYEYEIKMRGRQPGNWHAHPLVNVWEAGPVTGPGRFIEVTGNREDFVNPATLLNGETIEMESYGYADMWTVHLFWLAVGVAWLLYWFRRLPVMMRRYVAVQEYGEAGAEQRLISLQDIIVSLFAALFVVVASAAWWFYAADKYPITIPIQQGRLEAPVVPPGPEITTVKAEMVGAATFNLPLRRLQMDVRVTNGADRPVDVGQFVTGYMRFVNADVIPGVERIDSYDAVAPDGLIYEDGPIQPGETRVITVAMQDSLWEEQRMTGLVEEPDLAMSGILFFYDEAGNRYHQEVGGLVHPEYSATGSGQRVPDAGQQIHRAPMGSH